LWGGTDATSLVNLRYYYNPENGRLEPIAFNANPLSGDGRISLEATYGDPALQLAYSQAADQFGQPAYLEELQAALDAEWQTWQTAVRSEHQSQSPWETLAQRQTLLRLSLAPLQPVFAYLGDPSLSMEAIIQVDVANILNLPVEILGFDIDGATFLEADPNWLQDSSQAPLLPDAGPVVLRAYNTELDRLQFVRFHLPLTEIVRLDTELDFLQEPQILVATRILGQERPSFTTARPGYPNPILAFSPRSDAWLKIAAGAMS
jgi:hypothetical protein